MTLLMAKESNWSGVFSSQSYSFSEPSCQKGCQDHLFSLKPLAKASRLISPIEIPFCPYLEKSKRIVENIWPQANFDGKPHLPSFVLEIDQQSLLLREEEYRDSQARRLCDSQRPITELLEPHPGLDRKRCYVCKCPYEDYLAHKRSRAHKRNIKLSPLEASIRQLEIGFLQSQQSTHHWNNPYYTKRLRALRRNLRQYTQQKAPSFGTVRVRQKEQTADKRHLVERTVGQQLPPLEGQPETSTTKKMQQKTRINHNSVC